MAKIVRRNTLISEKVNVSYAYELILGSRKISCAEKTYKSIRILAVGLLSGH